MARLEGLNAQVLGVSVDSVPCLKAWADSLGGITYPLLADFWPHGAVAERYGVLNPKGHAERAIFVIDAAGVIRYIDVHDIDKQPDNEVVLAELARIEGVAVPPRPSAEAPKEAAAATTPPKRAPAAGRPEVVMYCSSWCPDCRRARAWLAEKGIAYREVDIYKDAEAAARVRGWADGKMVTPTFDCGGTVVVRFQKDRLEELLA